MRRIVLLLSASAVLATALGVSGAQASSRLTVVKTGRGTAVAVSARSGAGLRAAVRRGRSRSRAAVTQRSKARGTGRVLVLTRKGGFAIRRRGARIATLAPDPTLVVTQVYDPTCVSYYEPYTTSGGEQEYSDTTGCNFGVGNTGTATSPQEGYCTGYPGESFSGTSTGAFAASTAGGGQFACNAPDDNGSGSAPNAGTTPTISASGFRCEATVGSGVNGNTPTPVRNTQSVEGYKTYTDVDGNSVASIFTGCAGQLPAGVTIPTSAVTHQVACSELNPFGKGYVRGYGISATFSDGYYDETCVVPNQPVSNS
jgi:hypothetical protein